MLCINKDEVIEAINTYPKYGVDIRGMVVPWTNELVPYIKLRDVLHVINNTPEVKTFTTEEIVELIDTKISYVKERDDRTFYKPFTKLGSKIDYTVDELEKLKTHFIF